jgi:hypothetical protein
VVVDIDLSRARQGAESTPGAAAYELRCAAAGIGFHVSDFPNDVDTEQFKGLQARARDLAARLDP